MTLEETADEREVRRALQALMDELRDVLIRHADIHEAAGAVRFARLNSMAALVKLTAETMCATLDDDPNGQALCTAMMAELTRCIDAHSRPANNRPM